MEGKWGQYFSLSYIAFGIIWKYSFHESLNIWLQVLYLYK